MPSSATPLTFPEEVMLLALSRQTGAMKGGEWFEYVLGGAVLAELFAQGRVDVVSERKKDFLVVREYASTGDALLDECLQKIRASKRRRQLDHWLSKIANTRGLKLRLVKRLGQRGIIGLREDTVMWIFKKLRYPELNPKPEEALRLRLYKAIFEDRARPTERTIVLLSLLHHGTLLKRIFGAKELKARKAHIAALVAQSKIGATTAKVIEATEAAMVAVIAASTVVVVTS